MIKFENTEVMGWEAAVRGMRNPKNSWKKSDSCFCSFEPECEGNCDVHIGKNDIHLMKTLRDSGTDHRKFMRMIAVYVDITAPLYWWKEFDTYKVGTVVNSCSTMHKITDKEITIEDFSTEHLNQGSMELINWVIRQLNCQREYYQEASDDALKKNCWWQIIQLLPSSYNQKRTVMLNYEVLANIYKSRKDHKLDEWKSHDCITKNAFEWGERVHLGFCDWVETLPYSKLITG